MKLKDYDFEDIDEIDDIEDLDDIEEEIPKKKNATKKSEKKKIEIEDDFDDDLDEDFKEKSTKKTIKKNIKEEDEDLELDIDEDEEEKPVKKVATTKTTPKKKEPAPKKVEEDEEDDDDKDDEEDKGLIGKIVALIVVAALVVFLLIKGCSKDTKYTVKFDTNGGSSISEQKVKKDEKASVPVDPKKDGYEFLGWYVGDKKYDFDSKITENITIKAKWAKVENAKVSGISLDQTSLKMLPNDIIKLVATVEPSDAANKNVKWTVTDPSIATVDENGNVSALKEGTVIVTATSDEGGFTASCSITVSSDVVKVTGIELDKTSLDLATGSTGTITATITPTNATNKGVLWTSSDDSVVSVVNGRVTAKKEGTATITATTKDGDFKKTVTVTVKDVAVTAVAIKGTTQMSIGGSVTLTANVAPTNATNKKVTWSSSDTNIATVDANGKVVGKAAGTATITVKTDDGGKTATLNVTVKAPVAVTGVTLDKTSLALTEGNSATLKATVAPSDAANKNVTWTSSDSSVATVNNKGVVVAKKAGTTTITVTTVDGGKTATCTVTVQEKPVVKNYTYKVVETFSGGDLTPTYYYIKIYENGVDITSRVTHINGVPTRTDKEGRKSIPEADYNSFSSDGISIAIDGDTKHPQTCKKG